MRSQLWRETPPEQRVYVGRRAAEFAASRWANPYKMAQESDRATVLDLYRRRLRAMGPAPVADIRRELAGRVLGCWCAPKDGELPPAREPDTCHAQWLAWVAGGGNP